MQIIKNQKPDIIQGWMYHGNLAGLLGIFVMNKKTKLSWNIRLSLEVFSQMKFKTRLVIKLGAMLSKRVNSIIYNSKRSLKQHRQLGFSSHNDYFIPKEQVLPNSKSSSIADPFKEADILNANLDKKSTFLNQEEPIHNSLISKLSNVKDRAINAGTKAFTIASELANKSLESKFSKKEEVVDKEEEVPQFIEKKIKSA